MRIRDSDCVSMQGGMQGPRAVLDGSGEFGGVGPLAASLGDPSLPVLATLVAPGGVRSRFMSRFLR